MLWTCEEAKRSQILQAFAPALVATTSDASGRRFAFIICFLIFIVADIGLALQTNYTALLVLRAVQSTGSSATIALSMAVVADIATSAERGQYIGWTSCGFLMGPSFGPLLGGVLAQYLGWRSIFWFLAIFTGAVLVLLLILLPETCRQVVGNGSIPARGIALSLLGYIQQRRRATRESTQEAQNQVTAVATKKRSMWPNPIAVARILIDKESSLLLVYNAILFSGQMVISASLPSTLQKIYGYDELKVGLCFLPIGVGGLAASISLGYVTDWNFRRQARLAGLEIRKGRQQDLRAFPLEKARCQITLPNHVLSIAAMFAYGWVVQARTSIAGPEIVLFVLGFAIMGAFNASNAFLIDLHRDSPATATAAVNLTRCLVSAGGVAVIVPMINAMGEGWAFSVIGFIDIAMLPLLWVIMKWGPGWRTEKLEKEEKKKRRGAEESRRQIGGGETGATSK